jgi:hypothetical protein
MNARRRLPMHRSRRKEGIGQLTNEWEMVFFVVNKVKEICIPLRVTELAVH